MTESILNRRHLFFAGLAAPCLIVATRSHAQAPAAPNPNKLRLAAGTDAGNYTFAAKEIAARIDKGLFPGGVEVITTKGSKENLDLLAAGMADVAFTQSDVRGLWARENGGAADNLTELNGQLYLEYLHLLAPEGTEWDRVNDLGAAAKAGPPGARIAVGEPGTGTAETWRALRATDKNALYDKVERLPLAPGRPTLAQVRGPNSRTAMLWISGLNSADMRWANEQSTNNVEKKRSMRLLRVDDRDMIAFTGRDGQKVYREATIARKDPSRSDPGLYHQIMHRSSVGTLTVDAQLVVSTAYANAIGGKRSDALVTAIDDAAPSIHARVSGPTR